MLECHVTRRASCQKLCFINRGSWKYQGDTNTIVPSSEYTRKIMILMALSVQKHLGGNIQQWPEVQGASYSLQIEMLAPLASHRRHWDKHTAVDSVCEKTSRIDPSLALPADKPTVLTIGHSCSASAVRSVNSWPPGRSLERSNPYHDLNLRKINWVLRAVASKVNTPIYSCSKRWLLSRLSWKMRGTLPHVRDKGLIISEIGDHVVVHNVRPKNQIEGIENPDGSVSCHSCDFEDTLTSKQRPKGTVQGLRSDMVHVESNKLTKIFTKRPSCWQCLV